MRYAVRQKPNPSLLAYASDFLGLSPPLAVYNTREEAIKDAVGRNAKSQKAITLWNGSMQHYEDFLFLFTTEPKYSDDRMFSVTEVVTEV